MEFWKDLINLKESKKPRDKFLRVWAKNQLRFEIFEKILKFTCKNLNGKLIFYPFFSIFQDFFILYTSVTYQNFWWWLGGYFSPGLGGGYFRIWGGGGLYKSLTFLLIFWDFLVGISALGALRLFKPLKSYKPICIAFLQH